MPDPASYDYSRAAAFEERLIGALNSWALWQACQSRAVKRSRRVADSTSVTSANDWEPWSAAGWWITAEDSGQTVLAELKSHILPLVPGLDERLEDGIRVLDVGCGRGRALNLLANCFPNSRFVGIDLSEEAIKFARVEAEERGNKNASFIARDLSQFDQQAQPGTFDFITTFDAVHDQASPRNVLRGIRISLADDGVYLAQDIKASSDVEHNREHPLGPLLYTISCQQIGRAHV